MKRWTVLLESSVDGADDKEIFISSGHIDARTMMINSCMTKRWRIPAYTEMAKVEVEPTSIQEGG